jgi:hypothetical protein
MSWYENMDTWSISESRGLLTVLSSVQSSQYIQLRDGVYNLRGSVTYSVVQTDYEKVWESHQETVTEIKRKQQWSGQKSKTSSRMWELLKFRQHEYRQLSEEQFSRKRKELEWKGTLLKLWQCNDMTTWQCEGNLSVLRCYHCWGVPVIRQINSVAVWQYGSVAAVISAVSNAQRKWPLCLYAVTTFLHSCPVIYNGHLNNQW